MIALETPRLRVSGFTEADFEDEAAVLADESTMRFLEPPMDRAAARRFLEGAALCAPPLVYAVREKATGRVIGHLIFHPFDAEDWEIGWVLRSDRCGMGYGAELGRAAVVCAFEELHVKRLVAETLPENAACRALLRRLGFAPAGQAAGLLLFTLLPKK